MSDALACTDILGTNRAGLENVQVINITALPGGLHRTAESAEFFLCDWEQGTRAVNETSEVGDRLNVISRLRQKWQLGPTHNPGQMPLTVWSWTSGLWLRSFIRTDW